ncbi:MAG: hypothetical protein V1872_06380 [bacterium]
MSRIRFFNIFNFLIIFILTMVISYLLLKETLFIPHSVNKVPNQSRQESTYQAEKGNQNYLKLQKKTLHLEKDLNILRKENETLKRTLNSFQKEDKNPSAAPSFSKNKEQKTKDKELSPLNKKVLKNRLLKNLPSYDELFPTKKGISEILGGKWIFYDLDIIAQDKVRAYYEDGHMNGKIDLKFTINKGKNNTDKVVWELAS